MWHVPALSSLSPDVWVCAPEMSRGRNYPHILARTYIGHAQLTPYIVLKNYYVVPSMCVSQWCRSLRNLITLPTAAGAEIGYNLTQKNGHFIWAIKSNTHVARPTPQASKLNPFCEPRRR